MSIDQFWEGQLKLRQLRLLIALDDHRHVGRVAAALNITQPAVSRSLAEIEEGLGVQLFDRLRRGMVPTSAGECLIQHARAISQDLSRARDAFKSLVCGTAGTISIGTLPAAAAVLLPRALALLHQQFPDVTAMVKEGSFESLLPDLRARHIHLILGTLMPSHSHRDLDERALDAKPLTLVARVGHPLLERQSIGWSDLGAWPWVLPTYGSPLRQPLEEVFISHQVPVPRHCLETTSTQLVRTYVSMTDAIAFVPSEAAEYFDESGLLRALPFCINDLVKPTGVIWCRDRPLDPLVHHFIDCLAQASRAVMNSMPRARRLHNMR